MWSLNTTGPNITAFAPMVKKSPISKFFFLDLSLNPITFPPVKVIFFPILALPDTTTPIEECKIKIPSLIKKLICSELILSESSVGNNDFMLKNKMNTPTTSSIGRLFDGVSSLLDLIQTTTFEGEGAMILESIASPLITTSYEPVILKENGEFIIKLEPLITDIISDIKHNISKEEISAKFHNYICSIILKVSNIMRDAYSVEDVILSGGVFQNVYILNRIKSILTEEGFNVHLPKDVPINDGGISFGQLYLASLLIS